MSISSLMQVLQLGDSTLPVGAFSFSNGLESAIQLGLVTDVDSLRDFVLTVTQLTAGVDGIALLEAHRATLTGEMPRILLADAALFQRKLNEEMRTMSVRMGKKLAEMGNRVFDAPTLRDWLAAIKDGNAPGNYAVGQGVLFADLGLAETEAFAVHQYGTAATILGAALRLMRVDHLDTQTILSQVNALAEDDYQRVFHLPLEDMAAFTPALDIFSSVHVQAHVRMFMN